MFNQSRNTQINGGTFTVHLSHPPKNAMDLLLEASSPAAFHNSGERFDPPKCFPNTRVAALAKIMDWIIGEVGWDGFIMWLYGPAGAGKSAIAQTIAERCYAQKRLLASFFFSRSDPKRNNEKFLAASLAYQIAVNIPQSRSLIEGVVENDPAIFQRSFQVQFNALILEPLMQISKTTMFLHIPVPYLIIIDGLDECNNTNVQRHILNTISEALSRSQDSVPLMFLFSSRAERDINLAFSTPALEGITSRLALDDTYQPKADIRQYFNTSFSEMKKTHLLKAYIPSTWPADKDISLLVDKSSGQFIYAATVIRYISSSRYKPTDSLETILGLRPTRSDMPFAELDALYRDILSRVEDIKATLGLLVGIIFSKFFYQDLDSIEELMFLDHGDATRLLVNLSSIIMIDKYNCIKVLHASFGDFLLDQDRSHEYYINPMSMFTELAFIGLRHIDQYNQGKSDVFFLVHWWFKSAGDILFCANPTDELWERVLQTPLIKSTYDVGATRKFEDRDCGELVAMLLSGLKTSAFSNPEELYLHHRGVWDEILHKRLAKIESDTMVAAIVASTYLNGYYSHAFHTIFDTMCKLQIVIPLVPYPFKWLETTLSDYIGLVGRTHQELLLEFLGDPLQAGKYILDGTKFATLVKILLDFLIRPRDNKDSRLWYATDTLNAVERLIPQAGHSQELIELLTNADIIFPNECR